jgi:putative oxygen-independent coproporphyrinogen III oxidase
MKSLAVYIHWPFCKSKCPYCDFNSHVREQVEQERWKAALLAELRHMHAQTPDRRVSSIFFGGGTPSLMPQDTAGALIEEVHRLWPTVDGLEITLEANPTSVEMANFTAFAKAGVNRVSLGVQSLRADALEFLGREHSVDGAKAAIELARTHFPRYSFDLIYARPGQTLDEWADELEEALDLAGEHLSLYQLTIEENTAFYHAYKKGGFIMPDEAESEALYRLTEQEMLVHGLFPYEVSNYARPGEESRHNLSYWVGDDYVGVGPGAHGRLTIDGVRTATQTLKSPERWLENTEKQGHAIEVWQPIDHTTEAEERLMMGLRLRSGIDYAGFMASNGWDLRTALDAGKVALYQSNGLLEISDTHLRTTLQGRLVLNRLTAELLRTA